MLTEAQQERYARHLLLDDFGGEGQERLLAASAHVQGTGVAAHWAARYLAASGIGVLVVDDPGWRDELQALGPWLTAGVPGVHLVHVAPKEGATPAESAMNGAMAALETVRKLAR
jgi:adenylyltransferase/sulfurtransferase